MDKIELQQKIAEYYQKLPQEAQVFFAGMSWIQSLEGVSIEYLLTEDQTEKLITETTLLLLGILSIEDYVGIIKTEIKPGKDTVDDMIDYIGANILIEVSSYIEEAFIKNAKDIEEELNPKSSFSGLSKEINKETNNTKQKLYQIGSKYGLPLDKMGDIESVTTKFINGEISSIKYENELSLISELPSDKILEIINDINENIIKPKRSEVLRGEINKAVPLPPNTQPKKAIPVPPYAQPKEQPKIAEEIKTPESESQKIYKESGVEIVKDDSAINEPQEQPVNNIVTSKLFGTTSSKNVVNDYSIPKITPLNKPNINNLGDDQKNKHDAYREII